MFNNLYSLKKQYFFSFVLAILSVIAAKSIEDIGVSTYYKEKATSFLKEDGYFDLDHVNAVQQLPMGNDPLVHFSMIDNSNYACIQSDHGNVVLYNIESNSVSSALKFGILNSAAICHHALTHRLFIIGDPSESEIQSAERSVYTYNLNKGIFNEKPLFTFDVSDLEVFAEKNHIKINSFRMDEYGDTVMGLNFIPTSISVHPKTNEIYVLSSIDKSMAVFNQFGELVNFAILSDRQFSNPTGMTFNAFGDLFISNNDLMNNSIVKVNWNKLFQKKSTNSLIFGL